MEPLIYILHFCFATPQEDINKFEGI